MVETRSVAVPTPADTETELTEQVTGSLTTGVTAQFRLTVEGLNPPDGLIVMAHCVEPPAGVVAGVRAVEDRLKPANPAN